MIRTMYSLTLLCVIGTCATYVEASPPQTALLHLPEGWKAEDGIYPPGWASTLKWTGELKLRFSPGMFRENDPEFWSYVILYALDGDVMKETKELTHALRVYDAGLYGKKWPVGKINIRVDKHWKTQNAGNCISRWAITYDGFDPFVTNKPLTTKMEIWRSFSPKQNRTGVLILRSPLSPSSSGPTWRALRTFEKDFSAQFVLPKENGHNPRSKNGAPDGSRSGRGKGWLPGTVLLQAAMPKDSSLKQGEIVSFQHDTHLPLFETKVVKTFAVHSGGQLDMDVCQGNVEVTTSDKQEVKVEVLRNVAAAGQKEADQLSVRHVLAFTPNGDDLKFEAAFDEAFKKQHGPQRFRYIRFRVTVPKTYDLDVMTGAGHVSVGEIAGDIVLKTSAGNIVVKNVDGSIRVVTQAGNITAGDIAGAATADVLGGNITLGHVRGDVSAKTMGGNIKVNSAAGQIDARTNAGNVTATISEQPKNGCRLTTHAGNIEVRLRKTCKVHVEAKTDVGRISAPFPGLKRPRRKQLVNLGDALEAKLNGGGPGLVATANVGNITFEYVAE